MKIVQLAKELGKDSKEILQLAKTLGFDGLTHHLNGLTDSQADQLRKNAALFLPENVESEVLMRKAFGITRVNGKWGVQVFEYPDGKPDEVTVLKHITEDIKYKSQAIMQFKRWASEPGFSDIFEEEE